MRHLSRRNAIATILGGGLALGRPFATANASEGYPNRYIRLIVPATPGSVPDVHARFFAEGLEKHLSTTRGTKATVMVDNRPGASGHIGAVAAMQAPADGYTLLWAAGSLFGTNPFLFKRLPYSLDRFEPIGVFSEVEFVFIATPKLYATRLADVLERAKREPNKLNYANTTIGNQMHLTWERVRKITGAKVTTVAYRSQGAQIQALMTGEADFICGILSTDVLEHFESGAVVPLAVTGARRHRNLPKVPTMIEEGFANFTASGTYQLFVPKGVPENITAILVQGLKAVRESPETIERLQRLAAQPSIPLGPVETMAWLKTDQDIWRTTIEDTGFSLD